MIKIKNVNTILIKTQKINESNFGYIKKMEKEFLA